MENRRPLTISIKRLAEIVQGEIMNNPEKSEELVESLMVGAMCIDPAPVYFNLRSNKAVITRGDRADIQLGALATSTKCLILTGGAKPLPVVLQLAREKQVPMITVKTDTTATLSELEKGLSQVSA
ncbi:MAG: DRTGG domain-containing protein [Dehalococcoidia bacterium]